ncbi:hypothetical protein R75461_01393 [Paraburkholderia nemoris]|uniref:hypothetical protein n=1 Tax=Paraburkholderia nemoris TaxID=2793076 RepID=UPI00190D8422|nr:MULTISPECIES: hypothetical protein [Paraburkholderia]MBK3780936.1 hypothetical protein [Paraburkholderia aspalathi]CAE6718564.1 hypothetical protein R75461_01393 [Paraburkholderia nemoris]
MNRTFGVIPIDMISISSVKRIALMLLSGQQLLIADAAPRKVKKLLWYYDWATIGDSIMDLSQRLLIDPRISIDLCMPHGPVELFVRDARFRRVSRSLDDCAPAVGQIPPGMVTSNSPT